MATLGCSAPAKTGRPISPWADREIVDELMAGGIVPRFRLGMSKHDTNAVPQHQHQMVIEVVSA